MQNTGTDENQAELGSKPKEQRQGQNRMRKAPKSRRKPPRGVKNNFTKPLTNIGDTIKEEKRTGL